MDVRRAEAREKYLGVEAIFPIKPLFPYSFIFVTFGANLQLVPATSGLILACLLTSFTLWFCRK